MRRMLLSSVVFAAGVLVASCSTSNEQPLARPAGGTLEPYAEESLLIPPEQPPGYDPYGDLPATGPLAQPPSVNLP